jgi:hypothetical protein
MSSASPELKSLARADVTEGCWGDGQRAGVG